MIRMKQACWILILLLIPLVSQMQAQVAVVGVAYNPLPVGNTDQTALTGKIVVSIASGTTGVGSVSIFYGTPFTNSGTVGITVTSTFGATLGVVDSVSGRVTINFPAGGVAGDSITLEGVRVDGSLVEAPLQVFIGGTGGLAFQAGTTVGNVVSSVEEGLVIDPASITVFTFDSPVLTSPMGTLILGEGFEAAWDSSLAFGQTKPTQIQIQVGGLPATGATLTFPAVVTDFTSGGTLSLPPGAEDTIPTSTGGMSITYLFAGTVASPGQLEKFTIQFLLTATEQPAQTVTVFLQTTLGPNAAGDISSYLVNLLPAEEDLPFPEFEAFLPATFASDLFFGLAFTNPFGFEVQVDIEAFAPDGTLISGEGIVNPVTLTVGVGEQVAILLEQLLGAGILEVDVATLLIRSRRGQIAALFLLTDQANRLLDGTKSQTSKLRNFVLPIIFRDGLSATTKIQVFNPSATESVDVDLTLRDGAGSVVATRTETLSARATISEELSELMDVDPSSFEGGFLQGVAQADLVAWETFGDDETLNILDAQSANLTQKIFQSPHFAVGGGLDTELSLVNNDAIREGNYTVTALDEAGTVLDLPINPAELVVAPLAQRTVRLSDLFGLMAGQSASGSLTIEVEPILVGFIQVFPRLSASVRFLTTDGRLSATLPFFVVERSLSLFPHVAQDLGFFTGVAVFNPQQVEVVVTIEVFDELGVSLGSQQVTLPPGGRLSRLLSDLVEASDGRLGGYFRVEADVPVISVALFGDFAGESMSVIPSQ